jgi:predicted HTH transcriptional regulator
MNNRDDLKKAIIALRLEIDGSIVDELEIMLVRHDEQLISRERNRAIGIYTTLQLQGFPVSAAEFGLAIDDGRRPRVLTKRQQEIFEYLQEQERIFIKDVAEHFKISINAAYSHLKLLVKKGHLKHYPNETPAFEIGKD